MKLEAQLTTLLRALTPEDVRDMRGKDREALSDQLQRVSRLMGASANLMGAAPGSGVAPSMTPPVAPPRAPRAPRAKFIAELQDGRGRE